MEIITGKYTLKQIFKDHWSDFLKKYQKNIPDYVVWNIEKMLACRDSEKLGYHKYVCPSHSEEITIVPHSCKSRFCNSCGKVMTDEWINKACGDFPNTAYYHITFTISDKLRVFFLLLPQLRSVLFKSASEVILGWFKERNILPAVTCVLHTYGRSLIFHPHIHMIVSAGGLCLKTSKNWVSSEFIPYEMLKKRWKTVLLLNLKPLLAEDLKEKLFLMNWYVNVGLRLINARATVSYIGRYTKKPVIAETRIIKYYGKSVTFVYLDYLSNSEIKYTLSVEKFISLLIQHIPPRNFRMIRYYGLIANQTKKKYQSIVFKLLSQTKKIIQSLSWRARQIIYKRVDPLICKLCGREMILVEMGFRDFLSENLVVKKLG